jgi:hypothetical protein
MRHEDDLLAGLHIGLQLGARKPAIRTIGNPVGAPEALNLLVGYVRAVPTSALRGFFFL